METNINYKEQDNINLVNFLASVIRRKVQFFSFVLIGALAGLFLTFYIPTLNKGETIIEVGNVYKADKNGLDYIENIPQIIMKIENGIYGNYKDVKVKGGDSGIVEIEISSKDSPEVIKNKLSKLNSDILDSHSKILESQKSAFDKQLLDIEKTINSQRPGIYISDNLLIRFSNMKNNKDSFYPTKIIEEPIVYSGERGSALFMLDFILGGISGFIVCLFYFLVKDWWLENRAKIMERARK